VLTVLDLGTVLALGAWLDMDPGARGALTRAALSIVAEIGYRPAIEKMGAWVQVALTAGWWPGMEAVVRMERHPTPTEPYHVRLRARALRCRKGPSNLEVHPTEADHIANALHELRRLLAGEATTDEVRTRAAWALARLDEESW
jgi:hypothetical protein